MQYTRTTLLAGIAMLALAAGSSFASAEDNAKGQPGHAAAPQATQQPQATPRINQGSATGQAVHGAQTPQHDQRAEETPRAGSTNKNLNRRIGESPAAKEQNRSVQSNEMKRTTGSNESQTAHDRNKGTADNDRSDRGATAAERERMGGTNAAAPNHGRDGTAERQDRNGGANTHAQRGRTGMEGLQGNASGMNVRLTDQQRNEIRTTVVHASGAPRVGHVDFDVTVGTIVPRDRIHVVPVPETLVRIEPEWRGFLYFVYEDEVVVVNPSDMRIVAVVPA